MHPREISIEQAAERLRSDAPPFLLDCREQHEYAFCRIAGAELIPLSQFAELAEKYLTNKEREILIYCHHGVRSLYAADFLYERGYSKALSVQGGIDLWSLQIDPSVPRY